MRTTPHSIVLITVDCLRADHVGFLNYSGLTTPFLDSLADESFVFHNAIASGIPTYYSLPALFASRYPLALGRDTVGISPGENTVATELKECGYNTAGFVAANPYITRASGYDRGFDFFHDFLNPNSVADIADRDADSSVAIRTRANQLLSSACHSLPGISRAYDEIYFRYCQSAVNSGETSLDELREFPSADVIVDGAIAWLQEQYSEPFFLWLHLMDPHAPYYPKVEALEEAGGHELDGRAARYLNSYWSRGDIGPARLKRKQKAIVGLYDAGIRWADRQIGRLVQRLRDLNLWDQCAFVVTADHGEEFLDHGGRFHAPIALYEELVHIPLLFRVPECSTRNDVRTPTGLIDLAPTLLDAVGLSVPGTFQGRSRWHQITSMEAWNSPIVTECVHGCTNPFQDEKRLGSRLMAVRQGKFKLIVNFATGAEELFDLQSDPRELNPLPIGTAREERRYLLQCTRKHLAQTSTNRDIDARLAAKLRDLRLQWSDSIANRLN